MLNVQLFGPGRACYDDRPLSGFPNQQCYLLLCYLLLNRHHPHHRERLAAVFWDEYPTATSRKYLRNALWRLRHALQSVSTPVEEYLSISDDSVSFLTSSDYRLDVEAFEMAITGCEDRPGQQLTPEQADELECAADLYVGELLEGVYEDWCLYDRERLRLLNLNTLCKLLVFHERNGTYECGLAYGRRVLACDPTREKVHRQVMRLYWLLGDQNEALAQYRRCVQLLREELDIRPMEKTRFLHKQMVRNEFDPATWPFHRDDFLPATGGRGEALPLLAKQLLQRLRRLHAMTEETSTELQRIERLLGRVLLNNEHT
jgi:DNA-binding SARP family transcriptional activator